MATTSQGNMVCYFLNILLHLRLEIFLCEISLYLKIQGNFMHIYLLRIMPATLVLDKCHHCHKALKLL